MIKGIELPKVTKNSMENLEVPINLPDLKFNIPEDRINFYTFYKRLYQDSYGKYRYLLNEKLGLTKN